MNVTVPRSLRFRLGLAAGFWVVLAMVAGFFVLSSIFRAHVTEQFYEELSVHTEELERLDKLKGAPGGSLRERFSDPRYDVPLSGFYWEVQSMGRAAYTSASLEGRSLGPVSVSTDPASDLHAQRIQGPTGPLLLTALHGTAEAKGKLYMVGTDERHLELAVSEFDRVLTISLAGLGGVLILAVTGFVAFGLAPFNALARDLRRVRAGEAPRLEGAYPSEVQPLASELNSMICSQQDSLQRARAHAGNLAHGLKGPLAIIADEAYQLGERGDGVASMAIAEQCRAMQVHIDHHIARTRAQAMARTPGTRSDVRQVISGVCSALSRLHAGKDIALEQELDHDVYAILDAQDLNELVANVVDNAFKFARSRIIVRASAGDRGQAVISVEDDGPGLPPEARETVFLPGARLDESKPGAGLGLAIVRDLVELYQGKVDMAQSRLGGLQVRLLLPSATG